MYLPWIVDSLFYAPILSPGEVEPPRNRVALLFPSVVSQHERRRKKCDSDKKQPSVQNELKRTAAEVAVRKGAVDNPNITMVIAVYPPIQKKRAGDAYDSHTGQSREYGIK